MSCKLSICNRLPSPWQHMVTSNNRGLQGTFLTTDATEAPWQGNIKAYRVYPHWSTELPCSEWLEMSWAGLADQATTVINYSPVGLHVCHTRNSFRETLGQQGWISLEHGQSPPRNHTVAISLHLYLKGASARTLERHFVCFLLLFFSFVHQCTNEYILN